LRKAFFGEKDGRGPAIRETASGGGKTRDPHICEASRLRDYKCSLKKKKSSSQSEEEEKMAPGIAQLWAKGNCSFGDHSIVFWRVVHQVSVSGKRGKIGNARGKSGGKARRIFSERAGGEGYSSVGVEGKQQSNFDIKNSRGERSSLQGGPGIHR